MLAVCFSVTLDAAYIQQNSRFFSSVRCAGSFRLVCLVWIRLGEWDRLMKVSRKAKRMETYTSPVSGLPCSLSSTQLRSQRYTRSGSVCLEKKEAPKKRSNTVIRRRNPERTPGGNAAPGLLIDCPKSGDSQGEFPSGLRVIGK